MELMVNLGKHSYPIDLGPGAIRRIGARVDLNRKVMVVTDDGVPQTYLKQVLDQCPQGFRFVAAQGEGAKSFPVLQQICQELLRLGFSRKDLIIALGGGVVGDLAGMAAAVYMRGIDYIGVPTTTLAQIDSSIGGKTAVNLDGVKNCVGVFHQPRAVFADLDALRTLPPRHYRNGLAEAVKMGLIYDAELFCLFEQEEVDSQLPEIIYRSLLGKKRVVEQDETEQGLRKILNFGHTIGHGIETAYALSGLLHGECVALGMLCMVDDPALAQRMLAVYRKLGLPTQAAYDPQTVYSILVHDKKAAGDGIDEVFLETLGQARVERIPLTALRARLKGEG